MAHLLTFEEIYKERIWGGRNLERLFGKKLPAGTNIGESWELADLPEDKSVVANGPAAGKKIAELVKEWQGDLLGNAQLDGGEFPLFIKMLDANDILSVQVHPDYESAEKMGGSVRAKYEAWYIVDAEEDAYIYMGFKSGTTPKMVENAIARGTLATLLVKHPARKGDFFYLPGGTVHALGSGIVVAEIQTPSNTTFRLYDWNRVDAKTGQQRELHIDQSLKCVHFQDVLEDQIKLPFTDDPQVEPLVCAPTFSIDKAVRNAGDSIRVQTGEPIAWVIIEGRGTLCDDEVTVSLKPGQTVLVPAAARNVKAEFSTACTYLQARLTR
jgi:mannose-6-phosphate isomerase